MRGADSRKWTHIQKEKEPRRRLLVTDAPLAGLALPLSLYFLIFCISINTIPLIHLLLSFILGDPISFLDLAHQLIFLSLNHIEIVVGQLAPSGLERTFHLLPFAFHSIGIHEWHLLCTNKFVFRVTVLASTKMDFLFAAYTCLDDG